MKSNIIAAKQSSGFYDDKHPLEKQLREITITVRDRGPALNLKREKNEGESKTTYSVKEGVN